jgi:hypothetical protein
VTVWFTTTDEEVVECVICGDQWGVVSEDRGASGSSRVRCGLR